MDGLRGCYGRHARGPQLRRSRRALAGFGRSSDALSEGIVQSAGSGDEYRVATLAVLASATARPPIFVSAVACRRVYPRCRTTSPFWSVDCPEKNVHDPAERTAYSVTKYPLRDWVVTCVAHPVRPDDLARCRARKRLARLRNLLQLWGAEPTAVDVTI